MMGLQSIFCLKLCVASDGFKQTYFCLSYEIGLFKFQEKARLRGQLEKHFVHKTHTGQTCFCPFYRTKTDSG